MGIPTGNVIIYWIICALIVFFAGFCMGEVHAIGLFTKLGLRVLDAKGINVSFSAREIAGGLFQWQNQISSSVG
jgi:hypothetical protein